MPIELSSTIKKSTNWTFGQFGLNKIFSNDLYTALLTTIIIIIILFILDFSRKNTTWGICKTAFYIYVAAFGVLFFHRNKIREEYKTDSRENETSQFINKLGDKNNPDVAYKDDMIPVAPRDINEVMGGNSPRNGDNKNDDVISEAGSVISEVESVISETASVRSDIEPKQVSVSGGNNAVFEAFGV